MRQQLPDTPWHVGFTKKEEDDPRRHKARCIHNVNNICRCGFDGNYTMPCAGSSHCKYYAETEEQFAQVRAQTMTIEEEAMEKADAYKKKKIAEWHELKKLGPDVIKQKYGKVLDCPICGERLKSTDKNSNNRFCKYCGFNILCKDRLEKKILASSTKTNVNSVKQDKKQKTSSKRKPKEKSQKTCNCEYQDNGVCINNGFQCNVKDKMKCLFYKTTKK